MLSFCTNNIFCVIIGFLKRRRKKDESKQKRNNKIFRLSNGTIEIYNFNPIFSRLTFFRLEEMKQIPEDEQVVYKELNGTWFRPKKGIIHECDAFLIRKREPKTFQEKEENYMLVSRYTNGIFRDGSMHIRDRNDREGEQIIYLNPRDGTISKKIQVTPDLYLVYLLENERFAAEPLQDNSLEKQSELFEIGEEPIATCDLASLEAALESGLIKGEYDDRLDFIEGSTKVYEKLKRNSK